MKRRYLCLIFRPKKWILPRQTVYFLSKLGRLSKFPALDFLHCSVWFEVEFNGKRARTRHFLTAPAHRFTIHLESAAFVFHISPTTQGITGSLRAACSEPVQRFLACP